MELPIYIINVQPMLIDNSLIWDIFYLKEDSKDIFCLRIFNINLSFLLARLPNMNHDEFKNFISKIVFRNKYEFRKDLSEASYFTFDNNREYVEIFATNPYTLSDIYKKLYSQVLDYYSKLDISSLSSEDLLFYRNTETPFRFTETTTKLTNSVYNLSTKYDVPLIGGAIIDTSLLLKTYPTKLLPKIPSDHILGLNAQSKSTFTCHTVNENIYKCIHKNDKIDFKQNMTLLAYDIETYNPTGNLDPTIPEYYIFSIGIGIFNLVDKYPYKRYSILSKQFSEVFNQETHEKLVTKEYLFYNHKALKVYNEYCTNDNKLSNIDYTTYIFCKSEKDLLEMFIYIIMLHRPQVITGFNTFGFDDKYVYTRMSPYNLTTEYLQCFTYYDVTSDDRENLVFNFETKQPKWFLPFAPNFRKFELKIDNEPYLNNESVRAWQVSNVDVYKLMLKEDAKRFTQHGYGNLDTMLEAYNVKNPFSEFENDESKRSNKPLSKTGLKIHEMYRRWIENDNLYSIALYCCQDAWITGTLLISRSKLADLIEMSFISNTLFNDSIYRADGIRVQNSILGYAYKEKFALMDTAFEKRQETIDGKNKLTMGGKTFDQRVIVGGQVRNIHPGKHNFVVALDYASMYPANKEASNIDSSSRVDEDIIKHPEKYGLEIVRKLDVNDMYGQREIYYIKKIKK